MEDKTNRLMALEGLRGIAAVVVVFYHAFLMFYPYLILGPGSPGVIQHQRFEDNIFASPLYFLFSGTFAVAIFFVLSGFVLSVGFFQTGKEVIIQKLAAKRYLRLMLPALASVMLAWLLISLGTSHNVPVQVQSGSDWLADMWNFTPNFFDALQQGVWGVFANGQNYYNPVLWTMRIELLGSLLVFLAVALFGKLQKRWIIYVLLIFITFQTWYLAFVIGMILADLYALKKFPFNAKAPVKLMIGALVLGLFLGAFPTGYFVGVESLYTTMVFEPLGHTHTYMLMLTIGASLLMISALTIPKVRSALSSKPMSMLGKYTFSLYLMHKLVLFTITGGLFIILLQYMSYNWAVLLSLVVSAPVLIAVTYLFEKYVDAPSVRVSGVFANWVLGLPQKEGTTAYSEKVSFMTRVRGLKLWRLWRRKTTTKKN